MPITTNHSYVKFKMLYSTIKNAKLYKKVAYQQLGIASMQPLSLYIVHEYKFFSTLLADTIIFAVSYTGCNSPDNSLITSIGKLENSATLSSDNVPSPNIRLAVSIFES